MAQPWNFRSGTPSKTKFLSGRGSSMRQVGVVFVIGRALRNAVALALLGAAVCAAGAMVFLAACAPAPVWFFVE